MSLHHVLATAKKLGIPVVITDEQGEASQVVMPFEDFVAMVGNAAPVAHPAARVKHPRVVASGPTTRVVPQDDHDEIAEALSEIQFEGIREEPFAREDLSAPPRHPDFSEEKFYIEPLNDEEPLT